MFHSAALKLTLWYLAIIMLIGLSFSTIIYRVSNQELTRDAQRQAAFFRTQLSPFDFSEYAQVRQKQLNDERKRLGEHLVAFNLLLLFMGGVGSYLLSRRTLKPLETSLEAQSRFTADASHELRTPLAAIQTENEVALRNPGLTKSEAVDILKSNLEEVAKLKALSDGLLKLATEDKSTFSKTGVALKKVLDEAVERSSKPAQQKKINLKLPVAVGINVQGDHQSLVELFTILLDNAIKYSPAKSLIRITIKLHGREALISIKDQGQGIEAEDLPRIFDRFYRADAARTKSEQGGYGLGLALAKKITDLHHGYIEVKSAPSKGSTFIVHLPV